MYLRVASVVTVLSVGLVVGLVIDLGVPGGQALAQYYPLPPPYPPQSYPGPNRPPLQVERDDDLDALGPPRTYGYPSSRPPQQPGAQYGGRAIYPQDVDPYPPPVAAYPNGNSPPGYGGAGPIAPYPGQDDALRPPMSIGPDQRGALAALPPDYQPETGPLQALPPQFRRTMVDLRSKEPAGTIIIDTPNTYLYYVLGNGKAMRYGIGVGREGFTWAGTERISRMAEWPDWHPPTEMIDRQPYLPRFMAGGGEHPPRRTTSLLGRNPPRPPRTHPPPTTRATPSSSLHPLPHTPH